MSERGESRRRGEKSLTDLSRVFDEQQVAEMRSGVDTADRVDREETEGGSSDRRTFRQFVATRS